MKVLLDVVSQHQVVAELLGAMGGSIDRFSQDQSFDFRLVRVDQFHVPAKYVERFDDACMVYQSSENEHPSLEVMLPILERLPAKHLYDGCLQYAAVFYRSGNFRADAHWGACIYLLDTDMSGQGLMYVRLDCRENEINREEAPSTIDVHSDRLAPGADQFSLPWVLAWAAKEIRFELVPDCQQRLSYAQHLHASLAERIALSFERFRSGLGEVDSLAAKAQNRDAKRLLRYAWAWAAMSSARPSPMPGVGQDLEKLFSGLAPKNA